MDDFEICSTFNIIKVGCWGDIYSFFLSLSKKTHLCVRTSPLSQPICATAGGAGLISSPVSPFNFREFLDESDLNQHSAARDNWDTSTLNLLGTQIRFSGQFILIITIRRCFVWVKIIKKCATIVKKGIKENF